jgi:hypothetical protein
MSGGGDFLWGTTADSLAEACVDALADAAAPPTTPMVMASMAVPLSSNLRDIMVPFCLPSSFLYWWLRLRGHHPYAYPWVPNPLTIPATNSPSRIRFGPGSASRRMDEWVEGQKVSRIPVGLPPFCQAVGSR